MYIYIYIIITAQLAGGQHRLPEPSEVLVEQPGIRAVVLIVMIMITQIIMITIGIVIEIIRILLAIVIVFLIVIVDLGFHAHVATSRPSALLRCCRLSASRHRLPSAALLAIMLHAGGACLLTMSKTAAC